MKRVLVLFSILLLFIGVNSVKAEIFTPLDSHYITVQDVISTDIDVNVECIVAIDLEKICIETEQNLNRGVITDNLKYPVYSNLAVLENNFTNHTLYSTTITHFDTKISGNENDVNSEIYRQPNKKERFETETLPLT